VVRSNSVPISAARERPITVTEGTNTIVGNSTHDILDAANDILDNGGKAGRIPELWDGKTANRIADIIEQTIGE